MKYFALKIISVLIKLFFYNFFNINKNNSFWHLQGTFLKSVLESCSCSFHGNEGTITFKVIIIIFSKILIFFQWISSLQSICKKKFNYKINWKKNKKIKKRKLKKSENQKNYRLIKLIFWYPTFQSLGHICIMASSRSSSKKV
jgi:hypothetical protein